MLQSTGNAGLDKAIEVAFRRHRYQPGDYPRTVRARMGFTLTRWDRPLHPASKSGSGQQVQKFSPDKLAISEPIPTLRARQNQPATRVVAR